VVDSLWPKYASSARPSVSDIGTSRNSAATKNSFAIENRGCSKRIRGQSKMSRATPGARQADRALSDKGSAKANGGWGHRVLLTARLARQIEQAAPHRRAVPHSPGRPRKQAPATARVALSALGKIAVCTCKGAAKIVLCFRFSQTPIFAAAAGR
jgi:hypothetical protein